MLKFSIRSTAAFFILVAGCLQAADNAGFAIAKTPHGLDVTIDGKPFASYVIDDANKPYLWPVYGPTGKAMTRAYPMKEVPGEQNEQRDHPHHRGITFGHESIGGGTWKFPEKWDGITGDEKHSGGGDTWHERTTFEEFMRNPKLALRGRQRLPMLGAIKHREFTETKADAAQAVIVELCDYMDASGGRFLTEERRLTFRVLGSKHAIDIDQTFTASDGEVRFDDRKDAGLSIRVPASMAVDSKLGGTIINNEGVKDKDAWGKAAKWCDYNGPVDGEHLGIAFLNHPSSYRYPTRWHVRTYGLFTANPFAQNDYDKNLPEGTTTLKAGAQLKLSHRFLFHAGDAKSADIEAAWQQYAKEKK